MSAHWDNGGGCEEVGSSKTHYEIVKLVFTLQYYIQPRGSLHTGTVEKVVRK